MPNAMHTIDEGLPVSDTDDIQTRVKALEDYIYMLTEELRYLLRNIDMRENVNSASLKNYTETVTNPVETGTSPQNMSAAVLTANKLIASESVSAPVLATQGIRADKDYVFLDASEGFVLNSSMFGDTLPNNPIAGRIFFMRAT